MFATLPQRRLGRIGPFIPALGFGLGGLSGFYNTQPPDAERLRLLDQAYDLGETFWDSADVYGDSEDLLGEWFAANPEKRERVFLATKFGVFVNESGAMEVSSAPGYARKCCEKSLRRLGVESIDLFYCHRLDGKRPVEDVVAEMVQLKSEGKVRYLGISEVSADTLRRACKVHHIDAVQMEYSPFTLDIETAKTPLLVTARELGVAIVAYSPLGRGMLTGQISSLSDLAENDLRKKYPRFAEENFNTNMALVQKFKNIAQKKGCTPGQLSLAWLMAQGDDIFPIPGTKNSKYLEENVGSTRVILTQDELADIRTTVEQVKVAGARTRQTATSILFAETPTKKVTGTARNVAVRHDKDLIVA